MPHQLPPDGDWRTWVVLGGRGAGKTRAGAEWIRRMVEGAQPGQPGKARRIALVGDTYDQAREVMVNGDSGILAVSPPDRRPKWIATRKMLVWPNGAQAQLFSGQDPEGLRGPQFDAAWVDEWAKWRNAEDTWNMLQFGLRLGDNPRACVTTTPRSTQVLRDLLVRPSTVYTHATTFENAANLAPSFIDEVKSRYGNSRLGRQELNGELLGDVEGALWSLTDLDEMRLDQIPTLDRVVVAVDPAVTSKSNSDACGIVVVGARTDGTPDRWRAYVIADVSIAKAKPSDWAKRAVRAYHDYDADALVAETNQGGDLVETVVRQLDPFIAYLGVHATRGKAARAAPVAALYEQGRVHHAEGLSSLEDQMCQMTATGYAGQGSPDRVDALVWALHHLMIAPAKKWSNPRIRGV